MDEFNTPQQNNEQQSQPAPEHHTSAKALVWIVLALIVLGLVWILFMREGDDGMIQEGPVMYAPEGEVVSNFPEELLPEDGSYIDSSYSIKGEGAVTFEQPVVTFDAVTPRPELIAEYQSKLADGGWNITKGTDPNTEETVATMVAVRDGDTVNIVFQQKLSGAVTVTIALTRGVVDECANGGCDDDLITDETQIEIVADPVGGETDPNDPDGSLGAAAAAELQNNE